MHRALACLVAALLSGCASMAERERPTPRVDDQAEIFWLDNERVLYRGFTDELLGAGNLPAAMGLSPKAIRVLNIRTGEDRQLLRADFGAVCYSSGNILYERRDLGNKRGYYVWGPIEGEQRPSELTAEVERVGISSYLRCSSPPKPATSHEARQVVPLLEQHGFVEIRWVDPADGRKDEIWLHSGRGAPKLISEYRSGDAINLLNRTPLYAPWKNAYFLYRVSAPSVAWWLYPDGRTEKLDVPPGAWSFQYDVSFYPTKCGLIIVTKAKSSSLLLLPGDLSVSPGRLNEPIDFDRSRIAPKGSSVWRVVVSPDGTKAALRRTMSGGSGDRAFLEVVDVCR